MNVLSQLLLSPCSTNLNERTVILITEFQVGNSAGPYGTVRCQRCRRYQKPISHWQS
jgi:hypothetical protein